MFKTFSLVLLASLVLGLGMLVRAEDAPKPDKPDRPKPALLGSIVSVGDNTIVVKPKGGGDEVTVAIDASTKIRVDGEKATLADLKPGMNVTVPSLEKPVARVNARTGKKQGAAGPKQDE